MTILLFTCMISKFYLFFRTHQDGYQVFYPPFYAVVVSNVYQVSNADESSQVRDLILQCFHCGTDWKMRNCEATCTYPMIYPVKTNASLHDSVWLDALPGSYCCKH